MTKEQERLQQALSEYKLFVCTQEIKYNKHARRVTMFIESEGAWDYSGAALKFCQALKKMEIWRRSGGDETHVSVTRVDSMDGAAYTVREKPHSIAIPDASGF